MASQNAKAVAEEVLEKVRKGQKIDKGDIILNHGYSKSVSESPTKVTETQSYKEVITPVVERLEKHRNKIIEALESKDLPKEQYRDLIHSLDIATKNIQLLSGKETESNKVTIELVNYKDETK